MSLPGRATPAGTAHFARRFARRPAAQPAPAFDGPAHDADETALESGHFRPFGDLCISSVGFGLATGAATDEIDARYRQAVAAAVASGCNHFDVAISYRGQRSEAALGQALAELAANAKIPREEIIVASKAGFIPYPSDEGDAAHYVYEHLIAPGIAEPDDLAGGIHCMAPNFLSQQIAWSLRNTGLRAVDIYYIQNPETQLPFVDRKAYRRRLQLAFARLEEEVAAGRIGCYGVATWDSFRLAPVANTYMSLEVLQRLVVEVAGPNHNLRVVQLPVNTGMLEALTLRNQPVQNSILPLLTAARDLGFLVVASAALGQGQRPPRMADALAEAFPALSTPDQRDLQLVRSLPGVTSALFGSTDEAHVRENLAVVAQAPDPAAALRLAHLKGR
jgi:aryl-alcohol dehydrogenase-like predicted oxidoreductase